MALTFLAIVGLSATAAPGAEFESAELQEGALTQRSAADIAAMTSDCLETWAYHQQSVDEDTLESAFSACQRDAMKKFEGNSQPLDEESGPMAGADGRGLTCTERTWDCHTTTRCPRPWSPRIKCVIDYCGTGTCPSCPNFWGNIAVKSWCAYKCTLDGKVVGGAFEINAYLTYLGPVCFGG